MATAATATATGAAAAPVSPMCPTCGNFTPADDLQADINTILIRNRKHNARAEPPLPLSERLELRRKFVDDLLSIRVLADEYGISFPAAHRILRSTPMPASGDEIDTEE